MNPLHPATSIGTVVLNVSDIPRAERFYCDILGFTSHSSSTAQCFLSAGPGNVLVELRTPAGLLPRSPRTSGLYHFCLLVPARSDLGNLLARIVMTRTPVQGLVDHHFSESIYLADPDGNGIELSCDRNRDVWKSWDEFLRMGNAPLDVESLQQEITPGWNGLPAGARIGHIHLHVGDLDVAEQFYHGVLGFDLMAGIPDNARFVSVGGYHHHIAYNIWAGRGAPPAQPGSIGLNRYTITLPNNEALDDLVGRLAIAGIAIHDEEGKRTVRDPFSNSIVLENGSRKNHSRKEGLP
jgi:catechol 2,3-dioxygenase